MIEAIPLIIAEWDKLPRSRAYLLPAAGIEDIHILSEDSGIPTSCCDSVNNSYSGCYEYVRFFSAENDCVLDMISAASESPHTVCAGAKLHVAANLSFEMCVRLFISEALCKDT